MVGLMLKRHFTEELVFYGIVSSINPLRTELYPKIILCQEFENFFICTSKDIIHFISHAQFPENNRIDGSSFQFSQNIEKVTLKF